MAKPVILTFLGDSTHLDRTFKKIEGESVGLSKVMKAALGPALVVGLVAGLGKLGESFDKQFDKIRVSTGKTGDALKGLESSFKNVLKSTATDFDTAGAAVATLAQKMGLTGKPLEALAKQFINVSNITGTDFKANIDAGTKALQNFGVKGDDAPALLDQLYRASQASGVSFSDMATQMADAGVVLRQLGFRWETSAVLIGALGKAGVDVADVMPALSRAMATAAKKGESAEKLFKRTFDTIKNSPNGVAAAGTALEVFGAKAGPKLAALIREGKFSIDDMMQAVTSGQDTIEKSTLATQDFGEKWTILKNRVRVALEPLGSKVFDQFGKTMDVLGPFVERVADAFERGGFKTALGQIVQDFGKLDGKVQILITTAGLLAGAFVVMWLAALGPIPLIILGVGALSLAYVELYEKSALFREFANAIGNEFIGSANQIIRAINAIIRAYNLLPFHKDVGTIDHIDLIGGGGGGGAGAVNKSGAGSLGPVGPVSGRRAAGGPTSPYGTYLVGERGPELLTMGRNSGYVTPNGGGSMNVTINMPPGSSGADVVAAIQRYERRNGRGWRSA